MLTSQRSKIYCAAHVTIAQSNDRSHLLMRLPDLLTSRLRMSAATSMDCWELWKLWQDANVRTPPSEVAPLPLDSMVDSMRVCTALGSYLWVIRLRMSMLALGWVALRRPQRGGPQNQADLAVALLPAAWGNGYGEEAAQAALAHAFNTEGMQLVSAAWHATDQRGLRLLSRLGFQPKELQGEKLFPDIVYVLTGPEFRSGHAQSVGLPKAAATAQPPSPHRDPNGL